MVSLSEIKSFVHGRSLLLVGNSERIMRQDNSKVIDSYEIVVRMNYAVPQKRIGYKTDIWLCSYNNPAFQVVQLAKFNPKYIIRLNENQHIAPDIKDRLYIWPLSDHDQFQTSLGALPSTGVMAIHFFLNFCEPALLTIIGFDCFEEKTFYNPKKIAHEYHSLDKEKEYITRMESDQKIKWIKV